MTGMVDASADTAQCLPIGIIARYASVGFVIKALTLPLVSYLPPAYAQATGLSLATVGVLFMVARLWDIVLDPIAGYLVDRFHPPLGPRKFWILAAGGVMLATIPPVFAPAAFGLGHGGSLIGPACMLLLFYFGWTMMSVAHAAWPAELASDGPGRARLIAWREWAGVLGMLGIVIAPTIVERIGGHGLTDQLAVMGGFAMVAMPVAVLLALGLPRSERAALPRHGNPFEVLRLLRTSRVLGRLLAADLLAGSGFAMISATSFFIISGPLGLGGVFSTLMLAYFIGMIVGVPLLLRVTIVAGPRRSFLMAMGGAALATLGFFLVPKGGFVFAALLQLACGFFTGGYQSNLNALMVEVAEQDAQQTGQSAIGSYFALLALTNKLGYALAIGLCYPLLASLGIQAGAMSSHGHDMPLMVVGLVGAALLLLGGGAAFPKETVAL